MRSPPAVAAIGPSIVAERRSDSAVQPLFYRIWPPAIIALGLGLTAAWACLLGYGLVSLISLPI